MTGAANPSTVSEVLEAAAKLIEPEGAWRQGNYGFDGCFCVLGAIQAAGGFHHDDTKPACFLREFLGIAWAHEWNDAPERTQTEVVAKLREAAAKAREQGL